MLEEILNHLHNYFVVENGVHTGSFEISSGVLGVDFLAEGQYYKISGSIFNDGLHKFGDTEDVLADEKFVGEVWAMAVPKALTLLADEVEQWCKNNPATGYVSESFGGYSYSRGVASGTGMPMGWKDVFRDRMNAWRKIS